MSMWEFSAALDGYIEANTTDGKSVRMSDEEADEIWDWMQDRI